MDGNVKYWVALSRLKGLDRIGMAGLFKRFASPEEIFGESTKALEGFSSVLADAVRGFNDWGRVDKDVELAEKRGVTIVTFLDARYPALLKEIYDPPCLLYAKGGLHDATAPAVGVVGTRRPSHYGLRMAEAVAGALAKAGVEVVSGMARGCDSAAHSGALKAKGRTVAVLGTGIDVVYPKENGRLYEEIIGNGLAISEFPMSAPPLPQNFLRRNRIISGLSLGVFVAEAPLLSGSLMTARLALDYGRDVYAAPGQAGMPKCAGSNRLIREGALLTESAADILGALSITAPAFEPEGADKDDGAQNKAPLGKEERLIWKALSEGPAHIDAVIERTGLDPARVSSLLLEMELNGFVKERPGKSFLRSF